jgi:hypothetical protein
MFLLSGNGAMTPHSGWWFIIVITLTHSLTHSLDDDIAVVAVAQFCHHSLTHFSDEAESEVTLI